MANRPVFIPKLTVPYYFIWNGEFEWNRGLSASQKQKNVTALHKAFTMCYPSKKVLEISSKSMQEGGVELSAFSLKKLVPSLGKAVPVENVYQAGKYFAKGARILTCWKQLPVPLKATKDCVTAVPCAASVMRATLFLFIQQTLFTTICILTPCVKTPLFQKYCLSTMLLQTLNLTEKKA